MQAKLGVPCTELRNGGRYLTNRVYKHTVKSERERPATLSDPELSQLSEVPPLLADGSDISRADDSVALRAKESHTIWLHVAGRQK